LQRNRARHPHHELAQDYADLEGEWDESDFMFTRKDGRAHDVDAVSQRFNRLVRRAELPRVRYHDLRHTHATLLLLADVSPHVVSMRLGHKSVAFTLQQYAHVLPQQQADAVELLATRILGDPGSTPRMGQSTNDWEARLDLPWANLESYRRIRRFTTRAPLDAMAMSLSTDRSVAEGSRVTFILPLKLNSSAVTRFGQSVQQAVVRAAVLSRHEFLRPKHLKPSNEMPSSTSDQLVVSTDEL
jgi:hypothetical protein